MISKQFLLFNSILLFLIFGSVKLVINLENLMFKKNYEFIIKNSNKSSIEFVKIERLQNKSFFGYQHYFASISLKINGEKKEILKKITPTLYYKFKEGNQVEAIITKDWFNNYNVFFIKQIDQEINLQKDKNKNIEQVSNFFLVVAIVLFFLSFIKR